MSARRGLRDVQEPTTRGEWRLVAGAETLIATLTYDFRLILSDNGRRPWWQHVYSPECRIVSGRYGPRKLAPEAAQWMATVIADAARLADAETGKAGDVR